MTATPSRFVNAGPEFRTFVRGYEYTAYRLEVQDRYNDPTEQEHVARYVAGQPGDDSWMDDWTGMIMRRTLAGQRMTRVRVVSEPWSDYTRFGLHLSRLNVAAGEDIRYMPRDLANQLDLPTYDYWLIDSNRMCILRLDEDDVLQGADVIEDPEAVVQHCHYRDVALHHALPRAEYLDRT